MNCGEFLKSCRMRIGYNQAQMAHVLNLSQSDVSKIEKDHKEPRISIFRDWTIATQSMDLGIAFMYGTELLTVVPDMINNMTGVVAGVIHFFY